jgi:uncharacterized Fe-S center protein
VRSTVYFTNLRVSFERNLFQKFEDLLNRTGIEKIVVPGEIVAVKLHFGEPGTTATIRPIFVRRLVDWIRERQGRPFLTDTNTLYVGKRADSVMHIETALRNGYNYVTTGAPVIIGDGLRGGAHRDVEIGLKHYQRVQIADAVFYSDAILFLSHFKGHEVTGFGGALKNIAMGCSTKKGKLAMHSQVVPYVDSDRCTECGTCTKWCPRSAITLQSKATIKKELCIGCCECLGVCPEKAIRIVWNETSKHLQEKMVEYAFGVIKEKKKKVAYVSFLVDISPVCDCYPNSDSSIVPDIGILASFDPVAIDQASVDLVNSQVGLENSALGSPLPSGADKFRSLHPDIDWQIQLQYAQDLGLGVRDYDLVEI